jgi:hypothetical protein
MVLRSLAVFLALAASTSATPRATGVLDSLPPGWIYFQADGVDSWIGHYHDSKSGGFLTFDVCRVPRSGCRPGPPEGYRRAAVWESSPTGSSRGARHPPIVARISGSSSGHLGGIGRSARASTGSCRSAGYESCCCPIRPACRSTRMRSPNAWASSHPPTLRAFVLGWTGTTSCPGLAGRSRYGRIPPGASSHAS